MDNRHIAMALLCMALGGMLLLVAGGFFIDNPDQQNAPDFVIAMCGSAFIVAGCMILVGRRSLFNDLLAAILCLLFGATGAWVALFSPSDGFSGGLPLISSEANIRLARWVFGLGSLVCFALAAWALKRFFLAQRQ